MFWLVPTEGFWEMRPFLGQIDTTRALKNCQQFWQMMISAHVLSCKTLEVLTLVVSYAPQY